MKITETSPNNIGVRFTAAMIIQQTGIAIRLCRCLEWPWVNNARPLTGPERSGDHASDEASVFRLYRLDSMRPEEYSSGYCEGGYRKDLEVESSNPREAIEELAPLEFVNGCAFHIMRPFNSVIRIFSIHGSPV